MTWSFWLNYLERLAIVAVVLVALYVIARKLRELRIFAPGRRITVLESAMLAPNAALHVVRVESRYFLIASGSATSLAELAPPTELQCSADSLKR
ncbi:MAG: flagellar biosynthetic protein FliO [Candidatus Eremiobacteraeota bacterium]|nr:flagellar biosynthetic protein FliO [Candidatus Eremiobacteraeota bacterium]